jgi:hypothetical protein
LKEKNPSSVVISAGKCLEEELDVGILDVIGLPQGLRIAQVGWIFDHSSK